MNNLHFTGRKSNIAIHHGMSLIYLVFQGLIQEGALGMLSTMKNYIEF